MKQTCGRMMTWAFMAVVGLIVVAAANASSVARHQRARVRTDVLRSSNVPAGYRLASTSYWSPRKLATQGTWTLKQLRSWGYVVGYEVQYDRSIYSGRPAQISSDAGLYRSVTGAHASLRANANACEIGGWSELLLKVRIGNEAHLCTVKTKLRGATARLFFIVWRKGVIKGSITLTGLAGEVHAGDAIKLARTVAARMK